MKSTELYHAQNEYGFILPESISHNIDETIKNACEYWKLTEEELYSRGVDIVKTYIEGFITFGSSLKIEIAKDAIVTYVKGYRANHKTLENKEKS